MEELVAVLYILSITLTRRGGSGRDVSSIEQSGRYAGQEVVRQMALRGPSGASNLLFLDTNALDVDSDERSMGLAPRAGHVAPYARYFLH